MSSAITVHQETMTCPDEACGEVVTASDTWTEEYGDLVIRFCPVCECGAEIVKWINASIKAGL